jgi:hypothetical protein
MTHSPDINPTRLVDNVTLRRVVGEFAAQPGQRRAHEVLRSCMYGDLLFDVTGSTAFADGPFAAGSRLQIRGGTGPGGGRALFAFTRQEEIGRLYPPGTQIQSLVTPATGALGLARRQGDAWLYIDPAGPTCALSDAEIDFARRNPNNEPLKVALAAFDAGQTDRRGVLEVLRQDGPMMLGADDSQAGAVATRILTHPDGSSSLAGYTSAPEVVPFNPTDVVAALTIGKVLEMVRTQGYGGLILNPAGPSTRFTPTELFG